MNEDVESQRYRRIIERLVDDTIHGQGQIAADRVRRGVWVAAPTPDMGEARAINDVLARMSPEDRAVLAEVVASEFRGGIHQTLVALHEEELPPFDRAYEGTPFHDYIGRLHGWAWPPAEVRRS